MVSRPSIGQFILSAKCQPLPKIEVFCPGLIQLAVQRPRPWKALPSPNKTVSSDSSPFEADIFTEGVNKPSTSAAEKRTVVLSKRQLKAARAFSSTFRPEPVRVSVVLAPNDVGRKETSCNCRQFWKDRRLPAYCKGPFSAFLPQWLLASTGVDGHWEARRGRWP